MRDSRPSSTTSSRGHIAELEVDLLGCERGAVTSPAGCGKTQLIADTLKVYRPDKPVLVLTHTNAGVAVLRSRLKREAVPSASFRVSTVDGWAMRLISTFPTRSGHDPEILSLNSPPTDYPAIRTAAGSLLQAGHLHDALRCTYSRLFVDERWRRNSGQRGKWKLCGINPGLRPENAG
jgi:DNA helicase-2/ATP-dependent DNA helicase PcrA